jgi:hypothetical protein
MPGGKSLASARKNPHGQLAHKCFWIYFQPKQNVHQGCLARAILPQQGMNFPFTQRQVDLVIGNDTWKALGDSM